MGNLISVIVITYNEEGTIGRTLDSILAQRCSMPFEIVIGEDCSTDSTRKICEEYAARYPEIIRLMPKTGNKGIVDNFYDCLLACRGKYIADCDGDDYWVSPCKLERQLCILEANSDVSLVHTDWLYHDELTGKTHPHRPQPFTAPVTEGREMSEAIFTYTGGFVIHLCSAMFRKDAIMEAYNEDTYLFRNKNFGCEDKQAAFALTLKGKIAYIPEVTLHYSCGKPSACRRPDNKKQFRFIKQVTDMDAYICKRYGMASVNIDRYFQAKLFGLFMFAFRDKDRDMRNEAIATGKEWCVKPALKVSLIKFVTACAPLWNVAVWLRRMYVKMKAPANYR